MGLGHRQTRGALCATEPDAARVSPTRTRSVSTIATWTSFGSTLLNGLCPMDYPTPGEASGEGGLQGLSCRVHSPPSGHYAAPAWTVMMGPVCIFAPERWQLAGAQRQQKTQTKKRESWPLEPTKSCVQEVEFKDRTSK